MLLCDVKCGFMSEGVCMGVCLRVSSLRHSGALGIVMLQAACFPVQRTQPSRGGSVLFARLLRVKCVSSFWYILL